MCTVCGCGTSNHVHPENFQPARLLPLHRPMPAITAIVTITLMAMGAVMNMGIITTMCMVMSTDTVILTITTR